MTNSTVTVSPITVGLDVGDKRTHFCALDSDRKVVARGSFLTTRAHLVTALAPFAGAKVVLEAGSQSPWMSRVLRERGHEVQVADPRRVALISKDPRKTDRRDAEVLSRMASAMPDLLGSVHHRGSRTSSGTLGSSPAKVTAAPRSVSGGSSWETQPSPSRRPC